MQAHLLLRRADGQAGRIGRDDDHAQGTGAARRVRANERDNVLGDGGVGAPHLCPVDDPLIPILDSPGADAALQVGARARFGQRQAAQFVLTAGDERQPFVLLLLAAIQDNRRAPEPVVGGDGQCHAAAAPAQFLDGDGRADRVHARAAVFFGDVQPQHPQRPHLTDGLPVELPGFVGFPCKRAHFCRHKIVDGFLPHALFFVQVEIHCSSWLP